jgi:ElaB/YqjD/DUF883 family membrane-anchored ribosome-binding protein
MGKKPDEIENEIRRKRQEIEQRLNNLEQRAKDDVASARDAAKEKASSVSDKANEYADVQRLAKEHPMTTVLGAFGVGVALGMASEGVGISRSEGEARRQSGGYGPRIRGREDYDSGSGMLGSFLGPVLASATSTFQDELKQLIQTGFSSFKEGVGEKKREPGQAYEREMNRAA